MNSLVILFYSILGAIVGSFLNVVVLRYRTGWGIQGRSQCLSCSKTLHWYELVPILSFFVLRGRCSLCGARISWQYPLVELLTASIFGGVAAVLLPAGEDLTLSFLVSSAFFLIIFSILIAIFTYDILHKIIPNGLVYAFAALALLRALSVSAFAAQKGENFFLSFASYAGAGVLFFLVFAGLWFFSGGKWMGFGDAKLVLGIGFLLGLQKGFSALVFAFWIGAIVGLLLLSFSKRLTIKSEIPFAPFLILGVWIVFFFGLDVLSFTLLFSL